MKINKILIPIFICLCLIAYTIGYSTTTTTTNLSLVKIDSEDMTVDIFDTTNDNLDLIDAIFDTVSLVEFGYLDGVTSAIQTQLNAKQPLDAQLTDIAGLAPTDSYFIVGDGTNFITESGSTARTSLGLTIGTNVQAYDAGLLSLAGLTYASDSFIKATANDTYAFRTIAEVKADLDLEIGTDVQAYDAALTSISGLTYVSPSFIKLTANDTYAVRTIAEVVTDLALDSDDLSDVASIAMLDEAETITGCWTFLDITLSSTASDIPSASSSLIFKRARDGTPTDDVSSGDRLGEIEFVGYHTDSYSDGAEIRAVVDGTPGAGDMPGRLEFLTTPDASDTPVLRIAIDNAGNIKMGDGAWTNYVNVTNAGVLTLEGTANIEGVDATELGYLNGISAFGGSIIDDADEATFKATVNLEVGTDVLAQQTIGIGDDNLLEVDDADAADDEYAKFTANGLEGRSYAEVMMDTNPITTVTAVHTMTVAEAGTVLVSCAATPYTITLPTAVGNIGLTYYFIKTDANYFLITLDGDGTETIDYENSTGAPCLTYPRLNTYRAGITLTSDNSNWQVVDEAMGQVPFCWVYLSASQSNISGNVYIRIAFDTEEVDIGSNYDISTWYSGTTTGTTAGKLVDSGANFTGDLVKTRVKNTTDSTETYITAIDNATTLSVRDDIFVNGKNYEIKHSQFVCPVAGNYLIVSNAMPTNVIADMKYIGRLNVNGADDLLNMVHSSLADNLGIPLLVERPCSKDDILKLTLSPSVGGGTNTVGILGGNKGYTFFQIKLVSKE